MKQNRNLLFTLAVFLLVYAKSGYSQDASTSWTVKVEAAKVFIENKGQFPFVKNNILKTEDVLYAYDDKTTMIYLTKTGLSYCLSKKVEKEEENEEFEKKPTSAEEWKEREAEERKISYTTDIKTITWDNANPDPEIITEDPSTDYFSYSFYDNTGKQKDVNFIKGYKKITYKDLYPSIDVVYEFHPTDGIKYSLILHPGADISKVKMNYSGDVKLKSNGDLHIPTLFGHIIDHAPATFYTDNISSAINSNFVVKKKSVTFYLDTYDNTKSVTIDPWTQTPLMPTSHAVMECERDGAGNVYIIGGESPMQLIKYNAAGTIQWTYNTPYDTANFWLGTFATDLAGNSYVTAGSIAKLEKVNTSGTVVWTWSSGLLSVDEYWAIAFNCDQTKLLIGGTSGSMLALRGYLFDVNTTNGSVINSQVVGYGNMFSIPTNIQEVRSITSCRNARYYFLTLDTLGCIEQSLNPCPNSPPVNFKINHTYGLGYKCENYRPSNGNGAIESIKANRFFVYTQNGTNVHQRSLSTGAILATAAIPGGINNAVFLGGHQVGNSGIDIDTCGNVYVGSGNGIYKYDANLTPITSTATPYKVYDVAVSTAGNVIICGATGTNATPTRTGYIQSVNLAACDPMTLYCCDANICPAGPFCDTDPAYNLTAATPGGTWSGPGITDPSLGTFDPGVAGAGTFTIVYTLSCGSDSTLITVTNCGCPTITVAISNVVDSNCGLNNGSAAATGSGGTAPYSYVWSTSPQQTTATMSNVPPGTYTVTVTDAISCTATNTVTINNIGGPTLQTTSTSEICGQGNGSATVTATGGTGTYTYSWSTTPTQTTQTATNLSAGTYTVTVNDGTCAVTANVSVANLPGITTSISNIIDETCGNANGGASVTVSGGTQPYTYIWNSTPQQTTAVLQNVAAGTYIVTVTDANNCTAIDTAIIINFGAPVITVSTVINSTCGLPNGSIALLVSGGLSPYGYSWNTAPVQTTPTATNLPAGTYTVTVTDANNCSALTSVPLTTSQVPTASILSSNGATCGLPNGNATLNVVGGTPPFTYLWNSNPQQTGQNLQNVLGGNYSVTVTDFDGCTAVTSVVLGQTNAPTTQTSSTNETCGQGDGAASVVASGGTGTYTYLWSNGQTSASLSGLHSGFYTVTVNDGACTTAVSVTVNNIPGPNAAFTAHPNVLTDMDGPVSFHDNSTGNITQWLWDYGDNSPFGSGSSTSHQYPGIGVYVVTLIVTDNNGCTDTVTDTVKVKEIFTLYIPNTFTPNGDGMNELFTPVGLSVDPNHFDMYIFDRWGNIIYHTTKWNNTSAEPWNGTKNNNGTFNDVVLGVYVYRIKLREIDGPKHDYIGRITLLP